ncbi:hypothetical protein [Acinetobacter silvestris]|uniref:hypothetical protein n=1 Tax=Acinetobacter silvestris TaxID=1977882 RepID=UPI00148A520B|nr:hypothetical protein [Acinetobacter silvestris]
MSAKQPNKFIAPIVIAGITVGFLASAYKFVFSKPQQQEKQQSAETEEYPLQINEK